MFGTGALLAQVPVVAPEAATPLLVLEVLLIARAWGTAPAVAGATAAGVTFAFYFLRSHEFVRDLNDWVAFLTFTITAIIVGELSARAERRQIEAQEGRKEIEQLYQQLGAAFERSSEAEASRRNEQLKAALLDALTHNLRTPLTAIKASVTALLNSPIAEGAAAGASPEARDGRRELLQVIDEESDRLNRFIEALTVVDRPVDTSQPASLRATRLEVVVRDAVQRADTVLRRHHVRTLLDPAAATLNVEPSAIAEALYMLLDNASKYSPAGTTIAVESALQDDHRARIAITDEGPGIPDQFKEQVFEKFFRIPGRDAVDPRRGGIGLGLSIARRLIESQAGRIWIETPPNGRGTSVVFTLPTGAIVETRTGAVALTGAS